MTTLSTHDLEPNLLDEPTSEPPDQLWHIAATDVDEFAAAGGLSWRTFCGQNRPPARDHRSDAELGVMPDDCVVCADLYARWLVS